MGVWEVGMGFWKWKTKLSRALGEHWILGREALDYIREWVGYVFVLLV